MKHNSILLCLLFAIVANFISPAAKAQVNTGDSLALVDLYNSTNGPHWYNHTNWLTKKSVSTWYGVYLTNNRVADLYLGSNKLNGPFPSSIGNLNQMDTLYLSYNYLSGTIPASIGNLVNLKYLYVDNNRLSGAIPPEIGNLANLRTLSLNGNQLTGAIPKEIGNLSNLQYLGLINNQLSGSIPAEIGNLANLQFLVLVYNQLTGTIPAKLGNLANILVLNLSINQLSGAIPASIGNLANLQSLDLNHNQLSGELPASFSKFKYLNYLDVSYNRFTQDNNIHFALYNQSNVPGYLNNNLFTFNGLEFIANKYPNTIYTPQDTILPIHQTGNTLSVSAGGTLSNNTYNWFKAGDTNSTTINGDSTFTPLSSGQYYAYVTNSVATQLTLYSDTVSYTMPLAQTKNSIANIADVKTSGNHFSIYPNPASSTIHIQTTGAATIVVTNSAGKILLTKTINNSDVINVSSFANGTYYIQNKTSGETLKVVVIH